MQDKTIRELKTELNTIEAEYALGSLDEWYYKSLIKAINDQIKEKELIKVKVRVASMLDVLCELKEITASEYTKAMVRLSKSRTIKEIKDSTFNLRPDAN